MCKNIVEDAQNLITPPPEKYIYVYSEWQPMFESEAMKEVEFVRGIDEQLVSRENLGGKRTLLFLDDVADEIDEKLVAALFTKLVVISSNSLLVAKLTLFL